MRNYGQFCPIAKAAEIFCERWTALVIRNLGAGAERFSDIHRGVPHMSATLLTRRLRDLEAEGLVERRRSDAGKSWTYRLTDAGASSPGRRARPLGAEVDAARACRGRTRPRAADLGAGAFRGPAGLRTEAPRASPVRLRRSTSGTTGS